MIRSPETRDLPIWFDLPAQGPQGREEQGEVGHEDGKVAQREGAGQDLPRAEVHDQRRAKAPDDAEHGAELRLYHRAVHAGPAGTPGSPSRKRSISSSSRAKSLTALIPIMASCMTLAMAPSLVLTTRIRSTSALPVAADGEEQEGHGDER